MALGIVRRSHILFFSYVFAIIAFELHAQESAFDLGLLEAGQSLILPLDISELSGDVAIEVDGIDMTEFVGLVDGELVLNFLSPLAGEHHELTLYLLQGNAFTAIAHYSFSTHETRRLTASVNAHHEVTLSRLDSTDTSAATSSGTLGVESEDGTFSAEMSYLATTRPEEQINANPIDIGDYRLDYRRSWQNARVTTLLGHQALDYDQALVGNIARRGFSFDMELYDGRAAVGVFAAHSSDVLGLRNFTGLSDSSSRIQGARLAIRPFVEKDLQFSVQSYTGMGDPFGAELAGSGHGTSVSAEGASRNGRLRYGSVWSRVNWDEDAGGPLPQASGEALLSYASFDVLSLENSDRALTVGLAHERVDLDYFSLANPGVPSGAETWRLTLDYRAERFGLSMQADTQDTNEGGPDDWPLDRISQVFTDASYDLNGDGFWQGTALRFGAGFIEQDRVKTPNDLYLPEDYASATVYVGFDKSSEMGSWSLDYTQIREDDQTDTNEDTNSHNLSASFYRSVNEALYLNGSASYMRVDGTDEDWEQVDANLGFGYSFAPHDVILRMDAGISRTNDPYAQDGMFVSAELGWQFHPAAELVISASRTKGSFASDAEQEAETIFALTLRATTNFLR